MSPELLTPADIILDCTDNFETRYLINDFCVKQGKPWIYAAAIGAYAATMNILPKGPCLSCLFPTPPSGPVETCDTAGILSTAVNFAASIQTTEALKFLTGNAARMRRTLLSCDLWSNTRSRKSPPPPPTTGCDVCARRNFRYLSGAGRPHITLCGRNSVQIHEHARPIDLPALAARLSALGPVRANGLLLRFEYPPHTITVFSRRPRPDPRAPPT